MKTLFFKSTKGTPSFAVFVLRMDELIPGMLGVGLGRRRQIGARHKQNHLNQPAEIIWFSPLPLPSPLPMDSHFNQQEDPHMEMAPTLKEQTQCWL